MILPAPPRCLQAFFRPLRHRLRSAGRFRLLAAVLLAWLCCPKRPKLLHLAGHGTRRHRTILGRFLASDGLDAADLMETQALRLLRRMRPRRGEVLYLLIDDTRIAKRGRKMARLSKLYDHKSQKFITGHLVVCAAWRFRGVTIPWQFRLWLPKVDADVRYRKTTELAADLVRAMPELKGLRVRVLFDAFYLCPTLTRACQERGYGWFSVAASNRKLRTSRGWRGLADWRAGHLRHHGRRVRLRRARGWAWMRIAGALVHLSRIGAVKLVLSKRPADPWKKTLAVVTNEVRLSDREVLAEYEKRWWIEVLFKELRGPLGLGDYQVLDERKIVNHLHLCGLAHQVLTHHSLEAGGAKAIERAESEPAVPPLTQRLGSLREALHREQVEAVIARTRHEPTRRRLRKVLKELAIAA